MLDRSVAAKGPTVVAPGSAGASGGDGKPRMRRTTNIVKRENKMRNAILAGDTAFSCAPITRHLASLLTQQDTPLPFAAHHQTHHQICVCLPLLSHDPSLLITTKHAASAFLCFRLGSV